MAPAADTVQIETPPRVTERKLHALYNYWLELCDAAGGLPPMSRFDPLRLPNLLPNIWVIDVDEESHRFRMRLAGEDINAIYGRNIGGQFFGDIFSAADMPTIAARYTRALTEPAIFSARGAVYAAAGRRALGERLGLPMIGKSGCTTVLMGATIYGGRLEETTPVMTTGDDAEFHRVRAPNHLPVKIVGT